MQKRGKSKSGQVTIFIIIAIVIAAVLIIIFLPRITIIIQPSLPSVQIESCIKDKLNEAVEKVSSQGGSIEPENTILFQDEKIEYLCYTSEYYKTCTMQQPLLKQHIEKEISSYVKPYSTQCVENLKENLESRGYNVEAGKIDVSSELSLNNIKLNIKADMRLSKGEEKVSYSRFTINKRSALYSLVMISDSILNWEARYGDSDPLSFMLRYPNLKVEKLKQGDGSKIYILTDRETKEKFTFATRSLVWPAGYGFSEIK